MVNGAQGDDDEAHGGHFAIVTGRVQAARHRVLAVSNAIEGESDDASAISALSASSFVKPSGNS